MAKFGRTVEYLTKKPVDDVEAIKKAIRKIKDDGDPDKDSVENVFGACLNAAERFRSYCVGKERRRVMVIAVTDERGSDFSRVEEAITKLRRLGMRVYCVGDDAVFGREKHFFPHVFRDGFRGLGYTLRGPETARLENVQLPYWGRGDYGEITSGFGPYALSRLCDETGGMYLISEEMPGAKFDAAFCEIICPITGRCGNTRPNARKTRPRRHWFRRPFSARKTGRPSREFPSRGCSFAPIMTTRSARKSAKPKSRWPNWIIV